MAKIEDEKEKQESTNKNNDNKSNENIKKNEKETKSKIHILRNVVIIIVILLVCFVLGFIVYEIVDSRKSTPDIKTSTNTTNKSVSTNTNTNKTTTSSKEKINIKAAEYTTIQYETFSNNDISMKIPKGWKVEYFSGSISGIRAYNPQNDLYNIYYFIEISGFNKSTEVQQFYQNKTAVWKNGFEKFPVLNPATPENYYKKWTTIMSFLKNTVGNINVPYFYNFKVIEQYALNSQIKASLGNKATEAVLRASFTDSMEKKSGEGLFSTCIVDVAPNDKYFPLGSYNVMGITAPEEELINWESILTKCLSSITYSDSFTQSQINISNNTTSLTLSANKEISNAFNSYCNAWNNRQTSYDVTRQKYSDSTLGYERVYNTETGAIYKAYNGFTNSYSGNIYKTVTDDMYSKAISGYIEK